MEKEWQTLSQRNSQEEATELKQGSEASKRYWSQKDMGNLSLSRKENRPRGSELKTFKQRAYLLSYAVVGLSPLLRLCLPLFYSPLRPGHHILH